MAEAPVQGAIVLDEVAAILAALAAGAVVVVQLSAAESAGLVEVLGRRSSAFAGSTVGPIAIDTTARRVTLAGRRLELTRYEYALLSKLAAAPGRVFTKQELLREIWAVAPDCSSRRLDTLVARLRRRLGDDRTLLVTVWGVGYRLG